MLEILRIQAETGLRTTTRLTEEQLHEAEAAFRRLADKPRPLSFYLDYAFAHYREPESFKPLSEAITDYERAKAHEHAQGHRRGFFMHCELVFGVTMPPAPDRN